MSESSTIDGWDSMGQEQRGSLLVRMLPDAIYRASTWTPNKGGGPRLYLDIRHAKQNFAGDRNEKLYIDDRGVLVIQKGKGTRSPGYVADKQSVLDFCATHGIRTEEV